MLVKNIFNLNLDLYNVPDICNDNQVKYILKINTKYLLNVINSFGEVQLSSSFSSI